MNRLLLFAMMIFWTGAGYAQTIHVANNNTNAPTGNNVHATLQAAVDAASAGDIIHVIPSRTHYGTVTVTKRLTILGIGFNPDKDVPVTSWVSTIDLNEGSSGSRIAGLGLGLGTGARIRIGTGVKDISVESFQGSIDGTAVENVIVRNCIIILRMNMTGTNIIITNSIFSGAGILRLEGGTVKNSLFIGGSIRSGSDAVLGGGPFNRENIINCQFSNNIFYALFIPDVMNNSANVLNNAFNNNLIFGSEGRQTFPTQNGNSERDNIVGQNPSFRSFPDDGGGFEFTHDFRLNDGSPAKGKGDDGSDLGIYGGTTPFDPTGTPLPYVQSVAVPSAVKKGTDMTVTIRARGN